MRIFQHWPFYKYRPVYRYIRNRKWNTRNVGTLLSYLIMCTQYPVPSAQYPAFYHHQPRTVCHFAITSSWIQNNCTLLRWSAHAYFAHQKRLKEERRRSLCTVEKAICVNFFYCTLTGFRVYNVTCVGHGRSGRIFRTLIPIILSRWF